jgi:hypothetical protein
MIEVAAFEEKVGVAHDADLLLITRVTAPEPDPLGAAILAG